MLDKINILVVDGGGSRGVIAIEQLTRFEKTLGGKTINDSFDMFAGTSTGGIIAIMLSRGYTVQEIKALYVLNGPKIFDKKFLRLGLFRSKYEDVNFKKILKRFLKNETLKDCSKTVLIPTYNTSTMDKVIFKSFKPDHQHIQLFDIVRATTSAPTYFDPHLINNEVFIDGGLAINNPSMIAFTEALKMGYKTVNILSVGTGRREIPLGEKELKGGVLRNAKSLFSIALNEQTQTTDYFLNQFYQILPKICGHPVGKYVRAESYISHSTPEMDNFSPENIRMMLLDGDLSFQRNIPQFKNFKEVLL